MVDQFIRREVNKGLIAFAIGIAVPTSIVASKPETPLFDFALAGGFYHGLQAVRDDIKVGERLVLRAEPQNPHDANAVAVIRQGLMLGYIPREANAPIAKLLASGAAVRSEVVGLLDFKRAYDIPDDFVFTGFTSGDPRLRLTLEG